MSRIRLICPNCDAQYEVPAEVIPEGGRDVQCSNCAHTWFQKHPDQEDTSAEDQGTAPAPEEVWEPEPEAEDLSVDIAEESEEAAFEEPVTATPRRQLDPEVAEVLREEAERERRQRQAETDAFETQPDLGLNEPGEDQQARRAREARARMASIRGEDLDPSESETATEEEPYADPPPQPRRRRNRPISEAALAGRAAAEATTAAAESRKELLPDVEEINQTLRASSEPRVTDSDDGRMAVGDDPKPAKSGGGFARGFFLIVLIMAVALAVYVSAPQISEAVPQAAPVLDGYVTWVDGLRIWLDEQVTGLMVSLDSMSSETAPDSE